MTDGMWLPQPHQVDFSVGERLVANRRKVSGGAGEEASAGTYGRYCRLTLCTSFLEWVDVGWFLEFAVW